MTKNWTNKLIATACIGFSLYLINGCTETPQVPPKNPVTTTQTTSPTLENSINSSDKNEIRMLWTHIYNPQRLIVQDSFKTVTGTIYSKRREKDGDSHIDLVLDHEYTNLLNQENKNRQNGCLVCEPVGIYKVTQEDAKDAVGEYKSSIKVPKVGTHVKITGSYVLDKQHGWMEIHPVSKIEIDQ